MGVYAVYKLTKKQLLDFKSQKITSETLIDKNIKVSFYHYDDKTGTSMGELDCLGFKKDNQYTTYLGIDTYLNSHYDDVVVLLYPLTMSCDFSLLNLSPIKSYKKYDYEWQIA